MASVDKPMKNTVKQFGNKVREIRSQKKMSQGDVAKILGVHQSYISGIERGVRNPSLLTIEKIAKVPSVLKEFLIKF